MYFTCFASVTVLCPGYPVFPLEPSFNSGLHRIASPGGAHTANFAKIPWITEDVSVSCVCVCVCNNQHLSC